MKFEERVQIYAHKLNETDDQIVDYILSHRQEIVNMSIQKLSQNLYTVPNTIVRLAKKLGYKGFSELKTALVLEDRLKTFDITKISDHIFKTYDMIDMDTIDMAARKIYESKRTLFYGVGDSAYFCEMMAKNLRCVGKQAEFFTQRHEMIYSAEHIQPKDLIFVISVSGETKQVLDAVTIAKQKEVFIVSLTHLNENSLAALSNLRLYCWAPKQFINKYEITDRTSLMIVLRKLSEHYWNGYR
ncbi:MurR/RpiR family transcriptional regulator [Thermaerobacillus caldiproteolyticus]|uniref:MurR/RpiR family transcriptional regulator n=1 Tax=Thermaerobacillus caldiproteolyticus TaxID=247480 RepID=UPI00188A56D0|nr:MurR/RpiR family transcriptional regulator [Anoxybacillus caldiproteolyticus]QPA32328.1 MurR/RpiR family transcriptional regulator [Anoxybacillus caldiproteolyticus]